MPALQRCARQFAATHPGDVARVVEQSKAADAAPFLAELPAEVAASVIGDMSLASGAESLSLLTIEQAVSAAGNMPVGSAASLLRRIEPALRAKILAALPRERSDQITRLLEYASGTVGAAVDPEVMAIPSDVTNETARRLLRRRGGLFHHQLYIVDRSRRLLGFIHVRDLFRAAPNDPVMNTMRPATVQLHASTKLASAVSHRAWADMDAIPVVDNTGVLLGILRHRQLRRLESRLKDSGVASTLLGLSELYWIGLSSLFPPAPPAHRRSAGTKRGGDRANQE
ncbi:MAG: magnesium transporter [Gemmatimonadota bacterium]|nr:MAG: magnesium transporter [Gemmatimonadota bacterium]